jgi:hypothetical protein
LQELILRNCPIGHFGAKALASVPLFPQVCNVWIWVKTIIGLDGAWKLAGSLPRLVNLESLSSPLPTIKSATVGHLRLLEICHTD